MCAHTYTRVAQEPHAFVLCVGGFVGSNLRGDFLEMVGPRKSPVDWGMGGVGVAVQ